MRTRSSLWGLVSHRGRGSSIVATLLLSGALSLGDTALADGAGTQIAPPNPNPLSSTSPNPVSSTSPNPVSSKAISSKAVSSKAVSSKGASPKAPYAMQPKHPGVLTVKRGTHRGTVALRKADQVTPEGLDLLADVLKAQSGEKHPIDPGLADLFATVSDHFGGRTLDILDGYRPPPGHSNHNVGKAVDFRIEGVPIEAVRDFCLTLDHAGVGFYEGGKFVHLDRRQRGRSWTDDTPLAHPSKVSPGGPAAKAGSHKTPPAPVQPHKIPKATATK